MYALVIYQSKNTKTKFDVHVKNFCILTKVILLVKHNLFVI